MQRRLFGVGRFFSGFRKLFSKPAAPKGQNLSNRSVAYSRNGRLRFIFGDGVVINVALDGMSDRKVTAIRTGELITLVDEKGKILKEISMKHMPEHFYSNIS